MEPMLITREGTLAVAFALKRGRQLEKKMSFFASICFEDASYA